MGDVVSGGEKVPLSLWEKIKGYTLLTFALSVCFFIFVVVPVGWFVNNTFTGTKVCTVTSSKVLNSSSGGGTPTATRYIQVKTEDCGDIYVDRVKSPKGMNQAALSKFLNEHQGEKFEFITQVLPNPFGKIIRTFGISSTDPVE